MTVIRSTYKEFESRVVGKNTFDQLSLSEFFLSIHRKCSLNKTKPIVYKQKSLSILLTSENSRLIQKFYYKKVHKFPKRISCIYYGLKVFYIVPFKKILIKSLTQALNLLKIFRYARLVTKSSKVLLLLGMTFLKYLTIHKNDISFTHSPHCYAALHQYEVG